MKNTIEALKQYLFEVIGAQTTTRFWQGQKQLPFFLINAYNFYEISLFEQPCLLMIAKEDSELTPATIRKHWEQVQKKWGGFCVFVQTTITAYNRKRLVEHRVPFVIPENQMYLPELGIDLREHYRKQKEKNHRFFSPATQAIIIYALLYRSIKKFIPSDLARKLDYTLMTMTRAFDEIEAVGIGEIFRKGKERWWLINENKRELWKQAKPFMRTPVKKLIWVKHKKKPKIVSGLSALAHYSMINPPTLPIYAISIDQWKKWKQSGAEELPSSEEATFVLEIWYYNPKLFEEKNVADPFSLYLSLEASNDERIESALEEMMEKIKW